MAGELWVLHTVYAAIIASVSVIILNLDPRVGVWWMIGLMLALGLIGQL
jgi:hypothetical protein